MTPRFHAIALALVAATAASSARAQSARSPIDDYDQRIKTASTIVAQGPDLFGDVTQLKDGGTAFNAVDIDLPTNSGLPVRLPRRLGVNRHDIENYANIAADGELFGNWVLDVPMMRGIYDERTGWVSSMPNGQQRCSVSGVDTAKPPGVPSAYASWSSTYFADEYWSGNEVSIPGKGSFPLLYLPPGQARPSDGRTYYWSTRGDWRVSCAPTLKNGTGEGFVVALPDGTRYTFDWIASRKVAPLEGTQCVSRRFLDELWRGRPSAPDPLASFGRQPLDFAFEGGGGGGALSCVVSKQIVVNRREYILHATRAEDRFGNWVAWDYDPANPRRLRAITSSEGHAITLTYGANGKIASASDGARAWQYQYGGANGAELATVVQPDNSRWQFAYDNLATLVQNEKVIWADCDPAVPGTGVASVTMTHPSGARGVFTFRNMLHGTSRTPGSCSVPNPDRPMMVDMGMTPMAYKVTSLIAKELSGPGMTTANWNYQYTPTWSWNPGGYIDNCVYGGCGDTSETRVTRPDGVVERSIFSNDYYRDPGKLLKTEILQGTTVLQSTTLTYLASAAGQSFPDLNGLDPNARNNAIATAANRPQRTATIQRDGDTYTTTVDTCDGGRACYDAFARPTSVTQANSTGVSRQEVTEYHDNTALWVLGQVRRRYMPSTEPNGGASTQAMVAVDTEYNASALPWKIRQFGQLRQVLAYDAQGNLIEVADGNGQSSRYSDHYRGIPRLIRYPATPEAPAGATQSAVIDALGRITAITDEVGAKTCYGYDAMGRINSITYPSETQAGVCDTSRWSPVSIAMQQIGIDEHGIAPGHWRLHRVEGNRHVNTYFDAMWRPVLEEQLDVADIDGTLTQTVKRYDALGQPTFVSYPRRGVGLVGETMPGARKQYDGLGRVIRAEQDSETVPLVTTTEYLGGLRTRVTNPRGLVTVTSYLAWETPDYGLPLVSTQPENKVVEIARHRAFGWPLRITQRHADGGLQMTRGYVYDGGAQLCKTIEPESGVTVMGYDLAGNLSWSAAGLSTASFASTTSCDHDAAWNSGRRALRTYDNRGRLSTLEFPDTRGNQTWTYTADNLPATIAVTNEANGGAPVRTFYTYNQRRLLTVESVRQDGWYTWDLGYRHDAIGQVAGMSYPTGLSIDFAPNALGQATRAGNFATGAQYYPNGALKQFTYGNGVVYGMIQNTRQLPQETQSAGVLRYAYGYDANGNVELIYDQTQGPIYSPRSRWMSYDGLDRLTTVSAGIFGGDQVQRMSYDALDNLRSWTLAGVKDHAQYVYDAQTHRLNAVRDSQGNTTLAFEYDAQGNLQARNNQAYEFDQGNRLRRVIGVESYRYDGLGRRVQTTRADGGQSLWMYSRAGQMLFGWDGPSAQKTHEYIYLAGSLVASIDHDWPSNALIATKYHHTDALGSPVAVTDAAGQVIERNDYEPFGAIIGKPQRSGVGFAGHVMDGATGLTYMQQRYYDPSIGRFLSIDPVTADYQPLSGTNRYWYARNNPYRFTDPDGRLDVDAFLYPRDNPVQPDIQTKMRVEAEVNKYLRLAVEGNREQLRGIGTIDFKGAKLSLGSDGKGSLTLPGVPYPLDFDIGTGGMADLEGKTRSIRGSAKIHSVQIKWSLDDSGQLVTDVRVSLGKWGPFSPSISFKAKYNPVEAVKQSNTGQRVNARNRAEYIEMCTAENGPGCPSVYFSPAPKKSP